MCQICQVNCCLFVFFNEDILITNIKANKTKWECFINSADWPGLIFTINQHIDTIAFLLEKFCYICRQLDDEVSIWTVRVVVIFSNRSSWKPHLKYKFDFKNGEIRIVIAYCYYCYLDSTSTSWRYNLTKKNEKLITKLLFAPTGRSKSGRSCRRCVKNGGYKSKLISSCGDTFFGKYDVHFLIVKILSLSKPVAIVVISYSISFLFFLIDRLSGCQRILLWGWK